MLVKYLNMNLTELIWTVKSTAIGIVHPFAIESIALCPIGISIPSENRTTSEKRAAADGGGNEIYSENLRAQRQILMLDKCMNQKKMICLYSHCDI